MTVRVLLLLLELAVLVLVPNGPAVVKAGIAIASGIQGENLFTVLEHMRLW
jgi:hypothetical protein